MEGDGDVELLNCRTCGRNFRSDVLRKHEPICIKNSKKKRKIFDSGKQRAEGSDIPINKVLKPGEIPKADPKLAIAEAKTKRWREKHEMLVDSLRAARNYAKAKESGGPLPPPPPAVIDSSLVQCPYCQRRFNEESSKRHIPFCKDQQSKMIPKGNAAGLGKKSLYKAPLPRPKAEPQPQRMVAPSMNGQRSTPQMTQPPPNSRSEVSSVRATKASGGAIRPPVGRTQASPLSMAPRTQAPPPLSMAPRTQASPASYSSATVTTNTISNTHTQPRGSITNTRVPSTTSSMPRGPAPTKKANVTAPKASSTTATFCHECGNTFAVPSARFCSECGVRRLAL